MIILDTNVLSEQTRPNPSEAVLNWAASIPLSQLFATAVSETEMLIGIEIMPLGRRRTALTSEIVRIFDRDFSDRILPFDRSAARALSLFPLRRDRSGAPIVDADAMIAAIASAHGAAIATRDAKDFQAFGVQIINPWTARP